jgi:hypothetical protein
MDHFAIRDGDFSPAGAELGSILGGAHACTVASTGRLSACLPLVAERFKFAVVVADVVSAFGTETDGFDDEARGSGSQGDGVAE